MECTKLGKLYLKRYVPSQQQQEAGIWESSVVREKADSDVWLNVFKNQLDSISKLCYSIPTLRGSSYKGVINIPRCKCLPWLHASDAL